MQGTTAKISLQEYEVLPKSSPIKYSNLKEGRTYFIETKYILYSFSGPSGSRDVEHNIKLNGKFLRFIERPNYGGTSHRTYAEFEDMKLLVDQWCVLKYHPTNIPTIFDIDEKRLGTVFKEDHSPSRQDQIAKLFSLGELTRFISEKKMEPEETPSICFIGEDYREARSRFEEINEKI